ncbi:hypothetical protein EYF80_007403 [Liparis tanakae]|uniref:Uncharacterized protein n=1 Tax=Liparis tanakae TaxID=230148 RepID=A0A4Z2IYG1_9TELE|nr:hypothetical protein EYF80_007403 [Liparis tanakae]
MEPESARQTACDISGWDGRDKVGCPVVLISRKEAVSESTAQAGLAQGALRARNDSSAHSQGLIRPLAQLW